MSKWENLARFIRSYYDVAGASLLAIILLSLEKLMETEFRCPSDRVFGIIYSLTFIFGTTTIVTVLVKACHCHRWGDTEHSLYFYQESTERCGCCCSRIVCFVIKFKAPIFWFLILLTDGRYWQCLVMDEQIEVRIVTLQIFQVIGILLICIFVMMLVCQCERTSRYYKNKHKGKLFLYINEALQEQKNLKLKAFVDESLRDNCKWDPKFKNAERKWVELTEKFSKKVMEKLMEEGEQK